MRQHVTDYRPADSRPAAAAEIGAYINIGINEVGLFSREQYERLEESNKLGPRGDCD